MNSAAWRTSAGAAARVPVACAPEPDASLQGPEAAGRVRASASTATATCRSRPEVGPTARSWSSWAARAGALPAGRETCDAGRSDSDRAVEHRVAQRREWRHPGRSTCISRLRAASRYRSRRSASPAAGATPAAADAAAAAVGHPRGGRRDGGPILVDGELVVATMMTVTLSADHRVLNGAVASSWVATFASVIEQRVRLLA